MPSAKIRLDLLLVERGLFESRARAQAAIEAGGVEVDGRVVAKASQLVAAEASLKATPPHPYVSRAGVKLACALDLFNVRPAGRVCLDIGASTGGFTEVLLARGAAHVTAVDVGRGQLHASLVGEPRLTSHEGLDARTLTPAHLRGAPDLVVCDASFIGLAKILPVPLALAAPQADLIALIKPQYEIGPRSGGGLLAPDEAESIAQRVAGELDGLCDFVRAGFAPSPIAGGDGAPEFLYWARRRA